MILFEIGKQGFGIYRKDLSVIPINTFLQQTFLEYFLALLVLLEQS